MEYGSAKFEKRSPLLRRRYKGIKIGKWSLERKQSYNGTMLVAPTGSGKTQNVILKTVFHLVESKNSLVINDPKLELWANCSGWMQEKKGVDVYVLNLFDVKDSICWNCFDGLERSAFQGLVSDMYDMVNQGTSTESIWRYGTIELLVTLVCVLYDSEEQLHLPNLLQAVKQLQAYPNKTALWLSSQTDDEVLKTDIDRIVNQDEKIFHGMLAGAISVIVPFTPQELQAIQMYTSLPSMNNFRNKTSALFLSLPIGKESVLAPYITLLVSRIFTQILHNPVQKDSKAIAFVLEEFGQLLPIPHYQSIVSTIRSRKVMLFHCLQNLDQLSDRYGSNIAEIICNNCSHWLLLSSIKSDKTLRYVRDSLLGVSTFHSSEADDQRVHSRALMTKDEIRRLPDNTALFISSNELPVKIRLQPLYKSWYLKWKYGLTSDGHGLVSRYEPVKHAHSSQQITLIDFSKTIVLELDEDLSFDEQLRRLLPKSEE